MPDELDSSSSVETSSNEGVTPSIRDEAKVLATLETLKQRTKQLEKENRDLSARFRDVDLEEVENLRQFKTQAEELEKNQQEEKLKKEQQYEALLLQKQNDFEKQLKLLQKELEVIKGENQNLKTGISDKEKAIKVRDAKAAALDAFYANGGKRGTEDDGGAEVWFNLLWLEGLQNQVAIQDDGSIEIVDGKGETRFNKEGKPLTLGELMSESRSKRGMFFSPSSTAAGSGTPPQSQTRRPIGDRQPIRVPRSRMNELAAIAREHNIENPLKAVRTGAIIFED